MSVSAINSATRSAGPANPALELAAGTSTSAPTRRTLELLRALGRPADPHDPAVIRQTAAQMVSELFVVPMLDQMREFPFGKEIGSGGAAENAFGAQLDQRIADAVTNAQRGGLVDQLTGRLTKDHDRPEVDPTAQAASWLTCLKASGAQVEQP